MKVQHIMLAALITTSLCGSGAAMAQTAPIPAAVTAPTADRGDIIVTARKRQESILKVPVVEAVVSQEQLQNFDVNTVQSLSARVPGLLLADAGVTEGVQVSIRGVGTIALDSGIDQSVSFNIDGLQLNQGLGLRAATFDAAQIEVLKGPQALYFGKSSTAGVISVTTNDPTDKLEVLGSAEYNFQEQKKQFQGILSGPLSDTLSVRLAGQYSTGNGYFRNIAVGDPTQPGTTPGFTGQHQEDYIVRGTLLWQPSSNFKARLKVNATYDNIQGEPDIYQFVSCPQGVGTNPFGPNFLFFESAHENCKLDRNYALVGFDPADFQGLYNGGVPFEIGKQHYGSLDLEYHPADHLTLSSVTGYYSDYDESLFNGFGTNYQQAWVAIQSNFNLHEITQEVRFESDYSTPLNFLVGGFYEHRHAENNPETRGDLAAGLPALLGIGSQEQLTESYSFFGQLRYKIIPDLELAAGTRWTHERRTDEAISKPDPDDPSQNSIIPLSVPMIESNRLSPEVTLTWTPTDDLTVYGSLKQAYKSGGFTQGALPSPGGNQSYGDEKVQGGEVGLKGRLADRQIRYSVAGYLYKYTNQQVGIAVPNAIQGSVIDVVNAAGTKTYGVDFDMSYSPDQIKGLQARGAINWNHARYTKFNNAPCWGGQSTEEGCDLNLNPLTGAYLAQDLSGKAPQNAPSWQITGGLDYKFDLKDYSLTFSSDNHFSSSYLTNVESRYDEVQGTYFTTDLSIRLATANKAWELALIGTNLTNKLVETTCNDINAEAGQVLGGLNTGLPLPRGIAGINELGCSANPGREFVVRLTLRPDLF